MESISEQIESINEQLIIKEFGILRGIKSDIKYVKDNPEIKEKRFTSVQGRLFELSGKLKENLKNQIDKIRGVDKQAKWEFFIKSINNEKIINSNIKLIKLCIEALESVTNIQIFIGKELEQNVNSIIIEYKEFYNTELLCGDTCMLLHNYAFKDWQSQEYFLKLFDRVENIEELSNEYSQYKEEYIDYLDGYEEVVF